MGQRMDDPTQQQQGQSSQQQQQPGGPQTGGGEPQTPTANTLDKFMVDGRLDHEKLAEAYKSLEAEYGRSSNEKGDLRKKVEQYESQFSNLVKFTDPRTGVEYMIPKEQWERLQTGQQREHGYGQQQQPQQPQQQPLTQEQIDEQLGELLYSKPSEFYNLMRRAVMDDFMREMSDRERAFSDPRVQTAISQHPDIREKTEIYRQQYGLSYDAALKQAFGEKMMDTLANGGNQPTPQVPPAIGQAQVKDRTFMQPGGQVPQGQPQSPVTPEMAEMARRYGLDPKSLEPHIRRD